MLQLRCPYCGASEGRGSSSPRSHLVECGSCGRVVEERRTDAEELFVERTQDVPLCIITPDMGNDERVPALEEDPYESSGFITAFSTASLELAPLFTRTTTAFSGHLAELERLLLDPLYFAGQGGAGGGAAGGTNLTMVESLRAYFQIAEVSSILGLERDFCDHAVQLFRDCAATTYLKNRNIEALATAALVQAIREGQEPRTLQEISSAANIQQKEIGKYMKVLSDALKLSQPINSNSIVVHMPRFCSLLQLNKSTQELATHIGEEVINKSFCTRRNPISISAAAIYLSCQLEDKRKTQTEICRATGLTEVTLRKVYKELLENLHDLIPHGYTPAIPIERAFPTVAAMGRGSRTGSGGGAASTSSPVIDDRATSTAPSGLANKPDGLASSSSAREFSRTQTQDKLALLEKRLSESAKEPEESNIPRTNEGSSINTTTYSDLQASFMGFGSSFRPMFQSVASGPWTQQAMYCTTAMSVPNEKANVSRQVGTIMGGLSIDGNSLSEGDTGLPQTSNNPSSADLAEIGFQGMSYQNFLGLDPYSHGSGSSNQFHHFFIPPSIAGESGIDSTTENKLGADANDNNNPAYPTDFISRFGTMSTSAMPNMSNSSIHEQKSKETF